MGCHNGRPVNGRAWLLYDDETYSKIELGITENGLRLLFLRTLDAVLGTGTTTLFDARAVERATHDVVTDTWKIFDATPTHEDDGVLLELMAFVRNVRNNFLTVREAHLGDLTLGGVRLLRSTNHDLHTNAAAEG